MIERLLAFIIGKVQISVTGLLTERFLNLCAGNGLELFQLFGCPDGYTCTMSLSDYKEARRLARKCRVSLHIIKKTGLPFLLHRNRKRKAWVIGLLAGIGVLYVMSLFLWDIQFEGNGYYTDDILMTFLEEQQIRHGIKMSDISCDELEQALRNRYTNITWVSAQISGTRLIIQLKENFGLMAIPEEEEKPSDLVAPSDGTITEIVTRSGIPCVKAGDQVTKGQVLVSGRIPIKNDGGEIIGYHTTCADADIKAEIAVGYQKEFSVFKEENEVIDISFCGCAFSLPMGRMTIGESGLPKEKEYTITEYKRMKLFSNYILPVGWSQTVTYTCQTRVSRLTEEEQRAVADEEFSYFLDNMGETKVKLVRDDRRITEQEFTFIDSGSLVLEQDFKEYKEISAEEGDVDENLTEKNSDGNT